MNKALLRQGNKYSLSFDGVNDYVNITNTLDTSNGVSISLFVKRKGNGTGTVPNTVLSKWWDGSVRGFNLEVYSTSVKFGYRPTGSASDIIIEKTGMNTDNEWIHIDITVDGTTGRLFINGVESDSVLSGHVASNNALLKIGAYTHTSLSGYGNHIVDKVRIYSRALSHDEVKMLYRGIEPSTVDLKISLDMKEGTGTSTKDLSGNDNDGTLVNSVAWSTDVPTWGGV